jgi:type IV secretory pathway VirB2 component (pilin)
LFLGETEHDVTAQPLSGLPWGVSSVCTCIGRELFPVGVTSEIASMNMLLRSVRRLPAVSRGAWVAVLCLVLTAPALAQGNSPWETAVNVLQLAFTSTIARGLSLVAIVVSGLTFAFGEGGSKRVLAGVLFGVGMAIAAVNFLAWLFPV